MDLEQEWREIKNWVVAHGLIPEEIQGQKGTASASAALQTAPKNRIIEIDQMEDIDTQNLDHLWPPFWEAQEAIDTISRTDTSVVPGQINAKLLKRKATFEDMQHIWNSGLGPKRTRKVLNGRGGAPCLGCWGRRMKVW